MSTVAQTPSIAHESRSRLGIAVAALGALIAIGVAVLFLTLPGTGHTASATHIQAGPYTPLIKYYGTGAPPAATQIKTSTVGHSIPNHVRVESSYGAVP
jgi:hypothetical protein